MAKLWTLAQVFHRSGRKHSGHTMVVAGGNNQSYAQVDARSLSLAAAMSERGLGLVIASRSSSLIGRNGSWCCSHAKLGATVVPVNPRLNYHELKYRPARGSLRRVHRRAVRRHGLPPVLRGRHRRASGPAVSGHGRRRGAVVRRPDLQVRGSGLEWGRAPISGAVVG